MLPASNRRYSLRDDKTSGWTELRCPRFHPELVSNLVIYGVPCVDDARQGNECDGLRLPDGAECQFVAGRLKPAGRVVELPFELQGWSGFLFLVCREVSIPLLARFLFETCGHHQRSVHHCLKTFVVWHWCRMQMHRQMQLNAVAILPWPSKDKIATRLRESRHGLSIYLDVASLCPVRDPQLQIDVNGFGG